MRNDNYPVRLATIAVAGWAGLLATEDIVAAGFAIGGFDDLVGGLEIEFLGMEVVMLRWFLRSLDMK